MVKTVILLHIYGGSPVKETFISAGLRRIGKRPLKRLEWAVDFSQRVIGTPEGQLKAELELTCFFWAPGLQDHPGLPRLTQLNALMTDSPWAELSYRGQEVLRAQKQFSNVLKAAASDVKIEFPLKHLTVKFTRGDGVEYVSTIPDNPAVRTGAKLEAVVFKLLRLLDKTVRTSTVKVKGGERVTPVRLYVGICPEAKDGCGQLFAKTRIDQEYCSRTCVSRAQVYRFRRNQRALKRAKRTR
jgi:hypothetical protein